MDRSKLLATIGLKQLQLEELNENYDALLNMFAKVVGGQVATSQVLVNLTDRSWSVAPFGESPGMPATINGLPRCVVAPARPPQPDGPQAVPVTDEPKEIPTVPAPPFDAPTDE